MLNTKSLGIAGGLTLGAVLFVLTLLGVAGIGTKILALLDSLFIGYTITIAGSVIGLIYGFLLGFIVFYLIGYFYSMLETK